VLSDENATHVVGPGGSPAGASEPKPPDALEILQQRARLAEDRLSEVLAAYRQLKSENEGFRDRVTRNVERRYDQRRERLLLKFIEILDNLDRALESAERTYAGNPLVEGLILVRTQLLQTLKDEGLERIPVVGLPYDPAVSEAVETVPVEDPDEHHVVMKDFQRGYRLNGRVARASKVAVGEYAGSIEAGAASAAAEPAAPAPQATAPTPQTAAAPLPHTPEEEITLSGLKVDSHASAHAAAAAATELEADTPLDEIVARAEAEADPRRDSEALDTNGAEAEPKDRS
jgi:molecular chaperone GrpE